jgi:hypothetical protein
MSNTAIEVITSVQRRRKSLFALVIKISFGCTRDFRVNMWETSLPEDKLAGDLGNVIGATSIDGRGSDWLTAGKLAPGNLGLLQQYLPEAEVSSVMPLPGTMHAT